MIRPTAQIFMELDEMFAVLCDLCPELDIHSIRDEEDALKLLEERLRTQHGVVLSGRSYHTFSG